MKYLYELMELLDYLLLHTNNSYNYFNQDDYNLNQ